MNKFLINSTILFYTIFLFQSVKAETKIIVHSEKNTIEAPIAVSYKWFFNGFELKGEHQKELKIKSSGIYTVICESPNGLKVRSALLIVAANKIARIFLMGDSTVSDYRILENYATIYPQSGWGEHLQLFLRKDSLYKVNQFIKADSVVVYNRAIQGNSTRTYWQRGYYKFVQKDLLPGDYVLIQFGHNDEASCTDYPDRCVSLDSFKIYLNWFIDGIREKGAYPVLITPMVRSIWVNGMVQSDHDGYPNAMKEVGKARNVPVIDMTRMSIDFFDSKGQDFVNNNYFMIFSAGTYPNYLGNGSASNDNTHFREKGAYEMARLVFKGLQGLPPLEEPNNQPVQIYPNPAMRRFTVRRVSATKTDLSIINMKGSIVMKRTLMNSEETIDITPLARGLYIVLVDKVKYKIIIQ